MVFQVPFCGIEHRYKRSTDRHEYVFSADTVESEVLMKKPEFDTDQDQPEETDDQAKTLSVVAVYMPLPLMALAGLASL